MPKKLTCPDDKAYRKILSFSREVVKMWRNNGNFPVDGKEIDIPPKPIKVTFSKDLTDCRCLGKIKGGADPSYGISLCLPTRNLQAAGAGHWTRVEPFIAGIIMHEYVHCLQRPNRLDREIENAKKAGEECGKFKTPKKCQAYYTDPIEKDAHAAGIAVEIMRFHDPDKPISSKPGFPR